MDIVVDFPGGKQVAAQVGSFRILTDQPPSLGGAGAAPAPFELFLASLATCAGIYALGFCQARGLSTEGLSLTQRVEYAAGSEIPVAFHLEVRAPVGFPEKYRSALLRAVEGCKVKKTMVAQPPVRVSYVPDPDPGLEVACVGK